MKKKKKRTHNYPKNRKPRVDHNSMTQILLRELGEPELRRIWSINGQNTACKILEEEHGIGVSPYVFRYLSEKFNWKRTITNYNLPFVLGVLRGTVPASYYKHVIIPDPPQEDKNDES